MLRVANVVAIGADRKVIATAVQNRNYSVTRYMLVSGGSSS
jgi:hypothetical protein